MHHSTPYLLGFQKIGLGAATLARLRTTIPELERLWHADRQQLETTGASAALIDALTTNRNRVDLKALVKSCSRDDITIIGLDDPAYPLLLRETSSPPLVLFLRGPTDLLQCRGLTVVGTRAATRYGLQATRLLVEPLARKGINIISGLAFGIDAAAHESALAVQGPTLAVLGSGVDQITPVSNAGLGQRILDQGGAIVSEYPPGTAVQRHHFPQRNRILAGLAKATLVIEAGPKSGALITAKMAAEEGREVFAVPGPIGQETSLGTNELIKNGATPTTSAEDMFKALGLDSPEIVPENRRIDVPTDTEMIVLQLLREPRHVDELVTISTLDASVINATLSILELRGQVRHLGGMHYIRS
ncbi:MAG: DNA-protecting protein DprA [Candidatus Kerfeldbacteria bacterium]|nr:DNA-protecting protein DprA [Candidatus Kerfeldbacteria bacterium]